MDYINDNERCAICLEPNTDLITHCKHAFHASCLNKWKSSNAANNKLCPICRVDLYIDVKKKLSLLGMLLLECISKRFTGVTEEFSNRIASTNNSTIVYKQFMYLFIDRLSQTPP